MRVGEYCNRDVVIIDRSTGVIEAAQLMRRYHVGTLVVVEREPDFNRPVGIVTDRDLVIEVLAQRVDPEQLAADDIMSANLATAGEQDDVLDALTRMRTLGIRRMPIIDARSALVGLLAVDDLLSLLAGSLYDVVALVAREIKSEENRRP